MNTDLNGMTVRPRPHRAEDDRLRSLELEQTRLLARHESLVAQLTNLRSTILGLERLVELRLQRLEQLGKSGRQVSR